MIGRKQDLNHGHTRGPRSQKGTRYKRQMLARLSTIVVRLRLNDQEKSHVDFDREGAN